MAGMKNLMAKKNTMRALLYEHNILNGFWFVLIEFLLVALVALFVGGAEAVRGNVLWSGAWLGIAVNAAAICATVIGQMRRGERSSSLAETYSGKGREMVAREHPGLLWHTLQITAACLVPFLLAVLTLREKS